MKNKKVICPKCLGAQEIMEPKKTAGFEYKPCSLCKGKGEVLPEVEEKVESTEGVYVSE